MMTIDEFLRTLQKEQILLTEQDDKILCHVKKGDVLNEEYRLYIKNNKNELLKRLRSCHSIQKSYGLTPLQEGLLFHGLNDIQDPALYCQQKCWELDKDIDIEALKNSWEILFQKHEVLRAQFIWPETDKPKQNIVQHVPLPWFEYDLNNSQEDLNDFLTKDWKKGFDLSQSPLVRLTVLKVNGEFCRFVFTHHHLILDGWSSTLLIQELENLYLEQSIGQPANAQITNHPSHSLFVEWLEQHDPQAGYQFWQKHLVGFEKKNSWPFISYKEANNKLHYELIKHHLNPVLSRKCIEFAKNNGITINALMQFSWGMLLSIYSGSNDILFGMVSSGRTLGMADADKIIGMCINSLPFRIRINSRYSVIEHLRQVHNDIQKANVYDYFKLVDLRKYTKLNTSGDFFDSLFVFENYPKRKQALSDTLPWHHRTIKEKTNFPITIQVFQEAKQDLWIKMQLSQPIASKGQRMVRHYEGILNWLIHHAQQSPNQCDYLSEEERIKILQWSQGPRKKCDPTVLSIYYANPCFNSNKILCDYLGQPLSFRDFEILTNKWANLLRAKYHATQGDAIALLLSDPSLAVVLIFAILKLGAHYVPIHHEWPYARQRKAVSNARVQLWISDINDHFSQEDSELQVIFYQEEEPYLNDYPTPFKADNIAPDELVYTIYTSGTTSEPKGASVYHASVSNVLRWCEQTTPVEADSKFLIVSSLSFDLTQKNILAPVCLGAELHFLPNGRFDVWEILNCIKQQKITHLTCTPSVFRLILEHAENEQFKAIKSLKHIVFGGEKLRIPKLTEWMSSKFCNANLHNSYGPTECTDIVTCFTLAKLNSNDQANMEIPIGKPVPNLNVYILSRNSIIEGIGVPGELCIGGIGVGSGYISDKELSQKRFLPHPINPSERIYLSGDWGMWCEDGNIHFIGRQDSQIKFHGHRIDLSEIEKILNKQPQIKQSAVIVHGDEGKEKIIAYFVPLPADEPVNTELIRYQLRQELPQYMLPHLFIELSEIPLTHNGKVDRTALLAWDGFAYLHQENYSAPKTEYEQKLAKIWAEVLNQTRIGIHDNFFSLGGDSILSIHIVAKARSLGLKFEAHHLFQYPTVYELAKIVHQENTLPIDQGLARGSFVLSPPQAWFMNQQTDNFSHFNQSFLFDLKQDISIDSLERALRELVKHHDALRLRFRKAQGTEYAVFYEDQPLAFTPILHTETVHQEQQSIETLCNNYQSSLDIEQGPIMAVVYIKGSELKQHKLFITIHHLVIDSVSWRILLEDLQNLVKHFESNTPFNLPLKTSSYRSWVEGLQKAAYSKLQNELSYWQGVLFEYQALPTELSQTYFPKRHETEQIYVRWTKELTQKLLTKAHLSYNTRINDLLLAAVSLAFWRWKRIEHLWFILEGHGREPIAHEVDNSRTVGWFTSLFPQKLTFNPCFAEQGTDVNHAEIIKSIKEQLHTTPNHGAGFAPLKYYLNEPTLQVTPNVSFNYLGQLDGSFNEGWLLSLAAEHKGFERAKNHRSPFHLEMNAAIIDQQLTMRCRYSKKNYLTESVNHFTQLVHLSLGHLIEHCLAQKIQSKTPSDFDQVKISQVDIDTLSKNGVLQSAFPLTPLQEGMLFHSISFPQNDVYCTQVCLRFMAHDFDVSHFKNVWASMIAKYDVFRTQYVWENREKPFQVVYTQQKPQWGELNWQEYSEVKKEQYYQEFLAKDRQQSFDFTKNGLYRLSLIQFAADKFVCILTHHHLLLDGWSVSLLVDEVVKKYIHGSHSPTPAAAPKYETFVRTLYQTDKDEAKTFWKNYLQGLTHTTLLGFAHKNLDIHKPLKSVFRLTKSLEPQLSEQCRQFAKTTHISLSTMMEYTWAVLLYLYHSELEIVFGNVVSNRQFDESSLTEYTLGLLLATLPKRISLQLDASIEKQLHDLNLMSQQLVKYANLSLKEIQTETLLDPKTPLFTSLFAFENYPANTVWTNNDRFRLMERRTYEKNNYPFTLFIIPKTEIELRFVGDADCFEQNTIELVARRYIQLLRLLTEMDCSQPLDTLLYTFFKNEGENTPKLAITPIDAIKDQSYALSYHQERIQFIDQFETGTVYNSAPSYHNIPVVIHFFSAFNKELFYYALNALLKEHAILRGFFREKESGQTSFYTHDVQETLKNIPLTIHQIDEKESRSISQEIMRGASKSFDLNTQRIKIDIYLLQEHQFILALTIHHSLCDFRSSCMLAHSLGDYYFQKIENRGTNTTLQFMDFALWQRQLPADYIESLFFYWRFQLALPLQALKLPEVHTRAAIHHYTPVLISDEISKSTMQTLRQTVRHYGLSEEELFLGSLQIVLAKYANTNEIVLGYEYENRHRSTAHTMLGPLANLIVIRSVLRPHDELRNHFSKLKQTYALAQLYAQMPFDQLVSMLNPPKDMSRTALFDVLFKFHQVDSHPENAYKHHVNYLGYGKYDYVFFIKVESSGIGIDVIYNSDIYDEVSARQLLKHYLYVLQNLPHLLYERIEDIDLLSDEEKRVQLNIYNHPYINFPETMTLIDRFEAIALLYPYHTAIRFADNEMTYADLNRVANQLAHYLKHLGIENNHFVGLAMPRSLDLLVVILGILKAGAAYLPLDPHSPLQRNHYILEHSKTQYLITGIADSAHLSQNVKHTIDWNVIKSELHNFSDKNPKVAINGNDNAYCIYTSGTTGVPKGVCISHQNVIRLFLNDEALFDFSNTDRWLLFHSYHFDFSVWEIFGALLFGGCLVIVTKEDTLNPAQIAALLKTEKITILNQTPTAFFSLSHELAAQNYPSLDALRMVIFGGEKLNPGYLQKWVAQYPHVKMINMYGITETTVHVSYKEIQWEDIILNRSNIGKAIPTTQMYIMDEHQKLLPPGVQGEIYVSGAGISKGYLHNPSLTAERFIRHPFHKDAFLYRSGDKGKLLANGDIIYQGRNDNQINIRGFRVELGEIETCLAKIPGITHAIVLSDFGLLMTPKIIAYYMADKPLKSSEVYAHLSEFLPHYMLPSYIIPVPRIPLTIQGKVDKQALPSPTDSKIAPLHSSQPQTEEERVLAKIWSEVLNRDTIYLEDNFFELGGDSILIIVAISKAKEHQMYLAPKDFFSTTTLKELASTVIFQNKSVEVNSIPTDLFALSPIQKYFFARQLKYPHHFNQSVLLQTNEPLHAELLQEALIDLANYHDALRIQFNTDEQGEWKQMYQDDADAQTIPLTVLKSDSPWVGWNNDQLQSAFTDLQSSLNIQNGPMIRAALVSNGADQHDMLLLIIHHLVVDTVSWHLLIHDLERIYTAKIKGIVVDLPPKSASFYDWVVALERYKNSWFCKLQKYFWQNIIKPDFTPLSGNKIVKAESAKRSNCSVNLNLKISQNLTNALAKHNEMTIDDVLLIAVYIACQSTLDNAFICYKEGHGRADRLLNIDLTRTVGWFTSLYPVLTGMPSAPNHEHSLTPQVHLQQWLQRKAKIPDDGIGYCCIRYDLQNEELEPSSQYRIGINYLGHYEIDRKNALFYRANLDRGIESSSQNNRFFDVNVISWMGTKGLELKISYEPNILKDVSLDSFIKELRDSIHDLTEVIKQMPTRAKSTNQALLGYVPALKPVLSWHESTDNTPLILFPPLLGGAETYIDLAHHLGSDRPIYSLESYNLYSGHPLVSDLTELAWFYSTVILAILEEQQCHQHICLGGWSMGGLLAWEVASQLSNKSISIDKLYLIDTPVQLKPFYSKTTEASFEQYLSQLMSTSKMDPTLKEKLYKIHEAERTALANYQIKPNPYEVILFTAEESYGNLQEGWDKVAKIIECYQFLGSHFDIMKGENLQKIAAVINLTSLEKRHSIP
jgi:amino acid adenylation domain-containing protein/non-ribosomal peptide synthase protein (TIGR01720 family)